MNPAAGICLCQHWHEEHRNDVDGYDARVAAYEKAGMTRSDAQAVVDCEIAKEQRQ